jgi:hypothetical protein
MPSLPRILSNENFAWISHLQFKMKQEEIEMGIFKFHVLKQMNLKALSSTELTFSITFLHVYVK